jgi:hypothetical protein
MLTTLPHVNTYNASRNLTTIQVKLEPEVTIFEGGPDISETFVPAVSILTVIGLIPFAAAVARQVRFSATLA